jgi:peptidoglycan/LPS O-acetylase OafA/YrhL
LIPSDILVLQAPHAQAHLQSDRVAAARRGAVIPSLTGIRGIAALWVLLHHFETHIASALGLARDDLGSLTREGFRGVDLFFVLSGFVLMHNHAAEFRAPSLAVTRRFYLRRFLRIYPLNAAVLVALVPVALLLPDFVAWQRHNNGVLSALHARDYSAAGFLQSLALAQSWALVKLGEWNGPAWTLSAEVFGYLLFPALAPWVARQAAPLRLAALALASLAVLTGLMLAFGHVRDNPSGLFGLARMLFAFVAGMCLARCHHTWRWSGGWGGAIAAVSFAAALLLPFLGSWPGFAAAPLLTVFAFAGLVFGLAFGQGVMNTLFTLPPVMFLGQISFSLYLVHYVPVRLYHWTVETQLPALAQPARLALLAATLAGSFLLAVAAWRWVELPAQRLGRRLSRA